MLEVQAAWVEGGLGRYQYVSLTFLPCPSDVLLTDFSFTLNQVCLALEGSEHEGLVGDGSLDWGLECLTLRYFVGPPN